MKKKTNKRIEIAHLREQVIELEKAESKAKEARQLLFETNLRLQESAQELNIVKEKFIENIIGKNVDAILVVNKDGIISFANPAAESLFSKEKESIAGKQFGVPITGEKASEVDIIRKGGEPGVAETRVTEIEWEGELAWLVSIRDITELKRTERLKAEIAERKLVEETLRKSNMDLQDALKKLHDMQQQMIQQERLSALGEMASGIAHDFNNALVPILGFVEILLSKPDILNNRKETVEMLMQVRAGSMNAARTVRRLREFYRPSDLSQQAPVDLAEVIRNTVALTRPKWKEEMEARGIAIDIQTEIAHTPPVMGDEHELNQLLTNLIFNAVDAMPMSGSITIRLYPHVSGKHALLEVQDTGVGMSEKIRRRCLEPFFTTKGDRGVGLGLSVSLGIIQRYNGNIEIQSEPGKGTTFIVQLPLKESQIAPMLRHKAPQGTQPQEKEEPTPDLLPPVPSLRILCVDDQESTRLPLSRYLKEDRHIFKFDANGLKGLASFKAGRFDLVILDRAIPGMSGDELAAAIKARSPETPVIMLTGFGDIMRDQDEHPVGVDMIVGKPVTIQDMRRAIAEVMTKKQKIPQASGGRA